ARAVAHRAGAFDDEKALLRAHLAVAGAGRAGMGVRTRPRPGAVATVARGGHVDGDVGGFAVERLFERDFHIVAQIGAAPRLGAAAAAAAHEFAEDALEDIGEAREVVRAATAA